MIFNLPVLLPRGEISKFAVVTVVSQPHLRSYQEYFLIVNDYSTVVYDILVNNGPRKRQIRSNP